MATQAQKKTVTTSTNPWAVLLAAGVLAVTGVSLTAPDPAAAGPPLRDREADCEVDGDELHVNVLFTRDDDRSRIDRVDFWLEDNDRQHSTVRLWVRDGQGDVVWPSDWGFWQTPSGRVSGTNHDDDFPYKVPVDERFDVNDDGPRVNFSGFIDGAGYCKGSVRAY